MTFHYFWRLCLALCSSCKLSQNLGAYNENMYLTQSSVGWAGCCGKACISPHRWAEWLNWGLYLLPSWLTHLTGKLTLAVSWKLSQGWGSGGLSSSPHGYLHLHMGLSTSCLDFLQHGDWFPKMGIAQEPGRSCITFTNLGFQVTEHPSAIITSQSRFEGATVEPTSQQEEC